MSDNAKCVLESNIINACILKIYLKWKWMYARNIRINKIIAIVIYLVKKNSKCEIIINQ